MEVRATLVVMGTLRGRPLLHVVVVAGRGRGWLTRDHVLGATSDFQPPLGARAVTESRRGKLGVQLAVVMCKGVKGLAIVMCKGFKGQAGRI